MGKRIIIFITSVLGIPLVGMVSNAYAAGTSPSDVAIQLATGTSQMILSIVVVAEALAILQLFCFWRKDMQQQRIDDENKRKIEKEERERHTELLLETLNENSKTNANLSSSNLELKNAVYHFSNVIEKCKNNT